MKIHQTSAAPAHARRAVLLLEGEPTDHGTPWHAIPFEHDPTNAEIKTVYREQTGIMGGVAFAADHDQLDGIDVTFAPRVRDAIWGTPSMLLQLPANRHPQDGTPVQHTFWVDDPIAAVRTALEGVDP